MSADRAAAALTDGLREIFETDLVALVVYGSWLFEPDAPLDDLDAHTILSAPAALTPSRRTAYTSLVERIKVETGIEVDGWVVSRESLTSRAPVHLLAPPLRDESWALHRAHWLAGRARVLVGPPIDTLVHAPSPEDVADALRSELAYCVRATQAPTDEEWPLRASYVARNCCRLLATASDMNPVRSKSGAVEWALNAIPDSHRPLVEAAQRLAMRIGSRADENLVSDQVRGFLAWTRASLGWTQTLTIEGVGGIPEIVPGDDLGVIIAARTDLHHRDVIVIAQKVVSKAEGRIVPCEDLAARDAIIAAETRRVIARRGVVTICETHHGFVCANAGVDESNAAAGTCILLPINPDASAERIRATIETETGAQVGVIISDTFGRPWRVGQTDVALGVAGMAALNDLRGSTDRSGRVLDATVIANADELAGAAELSMGKAEGVPVVRIRGLWSLGTPTPASTMIRVPEEDLFSTGIGGDVPENGRSSA